jgi:ABC-2 type transport system permease protein
VTFSSHRVAAVLAKELAELKSNMAALIPVIILALVTVVLPFVIVVILPAALGEPLSTDADFRRLAARTGGPTGVERLSGEGAVQAFLFQQFLFVQLLIPVAGAMSFAGHSLIGEKQTRSLEPLLASPITTLELLIAKGLGALVPSLIILFCASAIFFGGIAVLAQPDVLNVVLNARSALVVFALGPAASLVALQIGVLVSSRVNDPRTAQQYSAFLILPLTALFAVQFSGAVLMTVPFILLLLLIMLGIWGLLVGAGVMLFDRETILTRWR